MKYLSTPYVFLTLLLGFVGATAVATFLENDYGTDAAWALVYRTKWFEALLLGLALCFIASIVRYRLFRREKWAILIFHLAFILIIFGAGITRYTSFSGVMRIREGEQSQDIISDANYLTLKVEKGGQTFSFEKQLFFSNATNNDFKWQIAVDGQNLELAYKAWVADAVQTLVESSDGQPMLEIVISAGNGKQNVFLKKGQKETIAGHTFGFEVNEPNVIYFGESEDGFFLKSPWNIDFFEMASQTAGTLNAPTIRFLETPTLYKLGDVSFVVAKHYKKANVQTISASKNLKINDKASPDLLQIRMDFQGKSYEIPLEYREGFRPLTYVFSASDGYTFTLAYGAKEIHIPFAIALNDFQLERYPGSASPSSYASEVVVVDEGKKRPYRIFMNHVLDYKGYRFFQASYDTDERGTVLSVNHDWWGTQVSYMGYLLMGLGMFFTLFSKKSRFRYVVKKLAKLKKETALVALLGVFATATAQSPQAQPFPQPADIQTADHFGRLLVQDVDGRIKPINTLALELLRKLSGKTSYTYSHGQQPLHLDANQTLLSMLSHPTFWQTLPLIKGNSKFINAHLPPSKQNAKETYAFNDFWDEKGGYLLEDVAEKAHLKKPADRTEYDKEMISIDERFHILYNIFSGAYLRVFPNKNDANHTWYSPTYHFKDFPQDVIAFAQNIIPMYLLDIQHEKWTEADEKLTYIQTYQKVVAASIIPSPQRISAELWYNKLHLNFWLFPAFFLLGGMLLTTLLLELFISSKTVISKITRVLVGLVILAFLGLSSNIILRWYVADHAPWSNGYEMLIFVAWGLLLSGLLAFRKARLALPLALLFSATLLLVSYLDWLNPEITTLMPVLKSYWLKIHVAVIVSSYAPLGLSAILGAMTLILMSIPNNKHTAMLHIKIQELHCVNELSMVIGVFLLSVGTFLGGVWANESWGRYWAWDPKETWALISIIVYAVVLHLRLIPTWDTHYVFGVASMFAFWSIIMTSFGVNYYLSGLHSYATGDPIPIPSFIYVVLATMVVLSVWAWFLKSPPNTTHPPKANL